MLAVDAQAGRLEGLLTEASGAGTIALLTQQKELVQVNLSHREKQRFLLKVELRSVFKGL